MSLGDMPSSILNHNTNVRSFDEDTDPEPTFSNYPVNCPKLICPSAKSGKVTRISSLTSLSSFNPTCGQFELLADISKQLNLINNRLAKSEDINEKILNENHELILQIQNIEKCELETSENIKPDKSKCLDCPQTCEVF